MDVKNKLGYHLYLRFSVIWGQKFTSAHTQEDFADMWAEDWESGVLGIDPLSIKNAIEYCKINLEWPPSLAEFRKICEKSLNIPSPVVCLEMAIRRDFSIPLVETIFNKIGSWEMKTGSQKDLIKKFTAYHKEILEELRAKKITNDTQIECDKPKLVHNSQGSDDVRKMCSSI